MTAGRLFAVKRFALHDGPGIRTTVFLKGCPLRCIWCHNPEGLSYARQLAFHSHLCIACGKCYEACSSGALRKKSSPIEDYLAESCVLCGTCAEVCPAGAIEVIGRDVTPEEVINEVQRDRDFYDVSGGGMTVSGGEPLAQPDFTRELLRMAKDTAIHTVLDTSGWAPLEKLDQCLELTDHVYYDVKAVDDRKHQELIGVPNKLILHNLRRVAASGKELTLRLPLVKGLNDSPEDILRLADLVCSLPQATNLQRLEIIPYHRTGEGKYRSMRLKSRMPSHDLHSQRELEDMVNLFKSRGLEAYCSQLVPPSLGGLTPHAGKEI